MKESRHRYRFIYIHANGEKKELFISASTWSVAIKRFEKQEPNCRYTIRATKWC
jgi:hypothetical protein